MNEINAEIADMIGDLKPEEEAPEEEVLEEASDESTEETDEEVEDDKEEEAEEEEPVPEVGEPEEETTEETGDEVDEPEEEPEVEEEEEEDLTAMLQTLGIPLPGAEPAPVVEPVPVAQPAPVAEPARQMSLAEMVILEEGADFDEIMESPEKFAEFQRSLLQRFGAVMDQNVGRNLPAIVSQQVRQIMTLNTAVDAFYDENKDLKEVRPTVGAVADKIVAAHPDWGIDKVMDESAKVTRKILKIPAGGKVVKKKANPSFVKTGKTKKGAPAIKSSKLQREIDDVIG